MNATGVMCKESISVKPKDVVSKKDLNSPNVPTAASLFLDASMV